LNPRPVYVEMTPVQVRRGEAVGQARADYAARQPTWQHRYGWTGKDPAEPHIAGAVAEFAVAIAACRAWEPSLLPDTERGDVGRVQVRSTPYSGGHLILHKRVWTKKNGWRGDRDEHAFVLVTGHRPCLYIRGWILGRDGKNDDWWGELQPGRPAYNVPQHVLRQFIDKRPTILSDS
jgi:hypothetical protein